jgi:hypothetical protein
LIFNLGQDVVVTFDGLEHPGIIEQPMGKGWVRCRIRIDPDADYGAITPRLGVESVVCVRETDIKPAE